MEETAKPFTNVLEYYAAKALSEGVQCCYDPEFLRNLATAYESGPDATMQALKVERMLKDKFKTTLNLADFRRHIKLTIQSIRLSALHMMGKEIAVKENDQSAPDIAKLGLNDQSNAERIMAIYGDRLRYCAEFKKWLVWDGRRWQVDSIGTARQMAKDTMHMFMRQSFKYDEVLSKFASASLNNNRITNMLVMLESELPINAAALDNDPWALNCLNGTVDLRDMSMKPHDPKDYITKLVHFPYKKDAEAPLWMKFLGSAMGEHPDNSDYENERAVHLVDFLQRALGYSITGSVSEKAVFIPIGEDGNNGKSTMLDTVRFIVREYATMLQVDTLMVRQESNNSQADLADLRGARFVQTSETEESQSLSQGKLKMLTAGMGTVKAVRKFENPFEFQANFHIWLDTNKMPQVRDPDDKATLARLYPIPFNVVIPENKIDRMMPEKLKAEGVGILSWMVTGAAHWYEKKLERPIEIIAARDEWRESQVDPWVQVIEKFLDEEEEKFELINSSPNVFMEVSIATIMEKAIGFKTKEMGVFRSESIRIGRIMKKLGWEKSSQSGKSRVRVYGRSSKMAAAR